MAACLKYAFKVQHMCTGFQAQWVIGLRHFQTSLPVTVGQKWRIREGLAGNNSKYGPMTDMPDYSYLDGRPTPLSVGQKRRRRNRINLAERMKLLTDEMLSAQKSVQNRQEERHEERQQILQRKLRPKTALESKSKQSGEHA